LEQRVEHPLLVRCYLLLVALRALLVLAVQVV